MVKKIRLKALKPGMIFKIVDDMKYTTDSYGKKGTSPKRVDKHFYLEEWHAVIEGEYDIKYVNTILFKQIRQDNGVDSSRLKDGEFKHTCIYKDVYDTEPPTEISLVEGKELRMIVSKDGMRAKLVDKK